MFITFLIGLLVPTALAQTLPAPLCTPGIFAGCGSAPANIIGNVALPKIAQIGLNAAAGLAVIFGLIGGARYLLSRGKDEEVEKGKTTIQWALLGMLVALASHRMVVAVITHNYVVGADPIFELMNSTVYIMMTLLNITFFLMILWGGFRMVYARGADEEVKKGRMTIIYAIIGVVIINVIPFVVQAVIQIPT